MAIHVQINISADEFGQLSETERSVLAALAGKPSPVSPVAEVPAAPVAEAPAEAAEAPAVAAPKKAPARKAPAKKSEPKAEEPKTLQEELADEPTPEPETEGEAKEAEAVAERNEAAAVEAPAEETGDDAPSLQDAVNLASSLMGAGKAADVKAALAEAGVKRVSELKAPADIAGFVAKLKAL